LIPELPVALLCTNVSWDSAALGQTVGFTSMNHWLRETVTYFASHPGWQLLIRIHPAELTCGSGEPADEVVVRRLGIVPPNIRIISPDERINTYSLMDICSFGIVYTSTTGLEMAIRGIPVMVAGRVHYSGKGFTTDVPSVPAYHAVLDDWTRDLRFPRLSPRQVELARCYLDLYYNKIPFPFPWSIGTLQEDLHTWPIRRILSEDGVTRFGRTFSFLAGLSPVDRSRLTSGCTTTLASPSRPTFPSGRPHP
jgi:hypothetical protein